MENFIVFNPTKIHFGKDVLNNLGETVIKYGNKILLLYGKGSVIKYGYYGKVMKQLRSINAEVYEYSGIKPNPIIEDVEKATELARRCKIEVIVAIGGGSVIDSAKIISLCVIEGLDPWMVMKNQVVPNHAVPLITVLTLAATGTEMNAAAVVQNNITREKIGYINELSFPKHSFLDPEFTVSVPLNYTSYGIVDLIAHALEVFFGKGECSLADRFVEAIIKEAMYYAPLVLKSPDNYEFRANIMLDAMSALNGITSYGKTGGDWAVHGIGHSLSLLYDVAHGASLSIAYPAWLRLQSERIPERIKQLGNYLFNNRSIEDTITKLENFFVSINSPIRLREIQINRDKKNEIIDNLVINNVSGMNHKLTKDDYLKLVDFML